MLHPADFASAHAWLLFTQVTEHCDHLLRLSCPVDAYLARGQDGHAFTPHGGRLSKGCLVSSA